MRNNSNYSEQIERLADELKQLRIDFITKSDRINSDINKLREEINDNQETDEQFVLGNHVEITNDYKGLKGRRGFIAKITDKQVVIQDEVTRKHITRSKRNVKKVES
jgi:hypothetical protein